MKRAWLALMLTVAALVGTASQLLSQSTARQPWVFVAGTCSSQVFGAVLSLPQTSCGGTGATFDSRQAYAPAVVRDVARVEAPCPGLVTGSVCYRMWYTGDRAEGTTRIGYAVSPDGVTWTRVAGTADGGSVLGPGAVGSFESAGPAYARVMLDGGVFRMWYAAYDASGNSAIGYATSTDGRVWSRVTGPLGGAVLKASGVAGTFDSDSVDTPYVLKDVATTALPCAGVATGATCYRMWYEGVNYPGGYKFRIGYATSPDGLTWTRVPGTSATRSVLDAAPYPEFDDNSMGVPVVLKEGAVFRMWYEAKDFNDVFQVGSVTSTDGVRWTRPVPNAPVWQGSKDPGTDLVPHLVWASDVIKEGAAYRLWYSTTIQPSSIRIGHAAMTQGSSLGALSASAAGTTYTVSFATAKAIPAGGSVLLTLDPERRSAASRQPDWLASGLEPRCSTTPLRSVMPLRRTRPEEPWWCDSPRARGLARRASASKCQRRSRRRPPSSCSRSTHWMCWSRGR